MHAQKNCFLSFILGAVNLSKLKDNIGELMLNLTDAVLNVTKELRFVKQQKNIGWIKNKVSLFVDSSTRFGAHE